MVNSPWFIAPDKPARPGLYEVRPSNNSFRIFWSYWDGIVWRGFVYRDSHVLPNELSTATVNQDWPWRGLIKQPNRSVTRNQKWGDYR